MAELTRFAGGGLLLATGYCQIFQTPSPSRPLALSPHRPFAPSPIRALSPIRPFAPLRPISPTTFLTLAFSHLPPFSLSHPRLFAQSFDFIAIISIGSQVSCVLLHINHLYLPD